MQPKEYVNLESLINEYKPNSYALQCELLEEENLGEFGESLVVCQILPSKFKQCLVTYLYNESKQAGISQSFYLPKVSAEKFAKVFFCQKFVLYGNIQM